MEDKSTYTDEIGVKICDLIAGGRSLLSILQDEDNADWVPDKSTVFRWLSKYASFRDNYARARESWAEYEFERMMQIADTPCEGDTTKTVQNEDGTETQITSGDMTRHRELQVSTRKWVLERMNARKYGQLIKQEITNPDGSLQSLTPEQKALKLETIRKKAEQRLNSLPPADGSDLV